MLRVSKRQGLRRVWPPRAARNGLSAQTCTHLKGVRTVSDSRGGQALFGVAPELDDHRLRQYSSSTSPIFDKTIASSRSLTHLASSFLRVARTRRTRGVPARARMGMGRYGRAAATTWLMQLSSDGERGWRCDGERGCDDLMAKA